MVDLSNPIAFETRILDRLKSAVDVLPKGTAVFSTQKDARTLYPHFRISPANPQSATIHGYVIAGQGIDYTIGRGTGGEIFIKNGLNQKARAEEEEFFQICEAVFRTRFTETLTYNSTGKLIRSAIVLMIRDREVRLGGHRIFWWVSPHKTEKRFSYEPYC